MVRWSEQDEIGVVGAKLLFPNGSIQQAGVVIGMGGHAGHIFRGAREGETGPFGSVEWYRNYLAVTGACMMIPSSVFEEVGGFNEDYQLVFSDIDLCLRITKRGYRVVYTPFSRLIHHESITRGRYIPTGDLIKAYKDFFHHLSEGDPYYNPNLSYRETIPGLILSPEDRIKELEQILARSLLVEGVG
jgi:GT2 family glycosyltransferase